ncbi:MAG TPA: retroviral-like aspartic protease family protein [Pyrinomonadaceae bacterium]|nr:retroviral-like aspartic protease family protein [Pyrinomonadaceae bacterium]
MLRPANYKDKSTKGTSLTGGKEMGYVYADIELTNQDDVALHRHGLLPDSGIKKVTCRALVDSGAWDLVINEEIQKQLNLPVLERQAVEMADDTVMEVDVVGPIEVRFQHKRTIVDAVVMPGTSGVLLGAYPMEGLDVMIDPKRERLLVNPPWPNNPKARIRTIKQVSLSI